MRQFLRKYIIESFTNKTITELLQEQQGVVDEAADLEHRIQIAYAPMMLPDLVAAMESIVVSAEDDPRVRGYAGGILSYVYNPLDFISVEGPVGLVDDTIICSMGLLNLERSGKIEMDGTVSAMAHRAARLVEHLDQKISAAIKDFVENLESSLPDYEKLAGA